MRGKKNPTKKDTWSWRADKAVHDETHELCAWSSGRADQRLKDTTGAAPHDFNSQFNDTPTKRQRTEEPQRTSCTDQIYPFRKNIKHDE